MKATLNLIFLIGCIIFFYSDLAAQVGFEGIIRYQINNAQNTEQANMLPEYTEYHIKGNNLVIQMIGHDNRMMARILIQGDSGAFYMIDDTEKTAMKVVVKGKELEGIGNVPEEFREEYEEALEKAEQESEFEQFDLVGTGEKGSIAGYVCEKYVVKVKNENSFIESEVWLTEKIIVEIPDALKDNNNPLLIFMNEKGFPLKFSGKSQSKGEVQTFEMTAVKVIKNALKPSEFTIPEDYHISDMTGFLEGN